MNSNIILLHAHVGTLSWHPSRVGNAGTALAWKPSAVTHWHVRMVKAQTAKSVFSWPASCTEANWTKSPAAGVLARTMGHWFPLHPSCVPGWWASSIAVTKHYVKGSPDSPDTASLGCTPLTFRKGQQTHLTLPVALGLSCRKLASPVLKEESYSILPFIWWSWYWIWLNRVPCCHFGSAPEEQQTFFP